MTTMPELTAPDYTIARFLIERGLGACLPDRLRRRGPPVPGPLRRARPPAGAAAPRPRRASVDAPSLFHWGYSDRRLAGRRLVGRGHRRAHRRRPAAARSAAGHDARLVRPLGPLPVDRQRRRDVLRVRLGVAPPRGGLPCDLPRQRRGGAAVARHPCLPMAGLPGRVRGRPDQAPRRSLLARPDLHGLPPRDAADAEPAVAGGSTTCRGGSTASRSSATSSPSSSCRSACSCPSRSRASPPSLMIGSQLYLVVSGNYAWLNWLTISPRSPGSPIRWSRRPRVPPTPACAVRRSRSSSWPPSSSSSSAGGRSATWPARARR